MDVCVCAEYCRMRNHVVNPNMYVVCIPGTVFCSVVYLHRVTPNVSLMKLFKLSPMFRFTASFNNFGEICKTKKL